MAEKKQQTYAKTPTVYQMESTECGAAALAMVLGYFGCFVPLERMRIETGVTRDGCNAKNIMKAARKFGLEVHGYRKDLDALLEMPVPCIIHWNFNHFVVWEGRRGEYCYINDPAMGRRKLKLQDIDECFTGVVLTFRIAEEGDFKKTRRANTLLRFVQERLRGQKSSLTALLVIGLLLVFPGMVIPIFSEVFIDDILLGGNEDWTTKLIMAMVFTAAFRMLLTYYRGMLLERIQNKMILLSGYSFLSHLFRLPMNFFDQRSPGELSQRVENNNSISVFLTSSLAETVLNIFVAAFYLILLFLFSPLLTLIGLLLTAINLVIMRYSSEAIADMSQKQKLDQGKLIGTLFSGLTITPTLKASGTENAFISRLQGYYAKYILTEQSMGGRQVALNAIPEVTQEITNILVLVVGGILVIRGRLTAGMLVAFSSLLGSFISPINQLATFIQRIQTARADMGRVEDIMRYEEDRNFRTGETEDLQEKLMGSVTLENISFGYSILEPPLVENFSFDLACGSSIAFVGASGSGKSTVSKICSGLYHPWGGEVRFDGIPAERVPQEVLASSISTVSQNITLFSGSVRDNLTMWNPYITDTDLIRAAKDACIHDVITSKPGAYDYQLTEGGTNFSGGQRQRLEIARALVTNPSVLILDEATSALDPIIEKQILDNIKRRGCTCIIVAHRLSAIRDCDEIIVMEHGKIVQRGRHEDLFAVEGHYQRLVNNL